MARRLWIDSRVGAGGAPALLVSLVLIAVTGGLSLLAALLWTLYSALRLSRDGGRFDCIIVPGKRLRDGHIDDEFTARLSTAVQLWRRQPVTVYVSGGICDGSGISEAQAGSEWLLRQGVDEQCLYCETRATTSYENLLFVRAIMEASGIGKEPGIGALVSSRYHLPRMLSMAGEIGVQVVPVPVETRLSFAGVCRLLLEAFYNHWYCVARLLRAGKPAPG